MYLVRVDDEHCYEVVDLCGHEVHYYKTGWGVRPEPDPWSWRKDLTAADIRGQVSKILRFMESGNAEQEC